MWRFLPLMANGGCVWLTARANDCWHNRPRDCWDGPATNLDWRLVWNGVRWSTDDADGFSRRVGRWDIRRSTFREGGVSHHLLVLTDLSQTLREEERTAWQRLLRVLGHELNNSLAPIKSVAGSLADLLERQPEPADYREDMQRGLEVISSRADSLARFVESYSKLARLPQPRFEALSVGELVQRVASLETRLPVSVFPGPTLVSRAITHSWNSC